MGVDFIRFILFFSSYLIVNGNFNNTNDHVILVAPVLAPPGRARVTETAKDFPVVMLLATGNKTETKLNRKSKDGESQPIYVEVSIYNLNLIFSPLVILLDEFVVYICVVLIVKETKKCL